MKDLNDKISQLKDEHSAQLVEQDGREIDEQAKADALFMLGRIWQNETVADAIYTNLASQTILALERFQEQRAYIALGYDRFDDFLDNSSYSKLKKSQFYERRALIKKHGPEIYDLLTSVGIGVRSQKMLGKGELAISGDKLVVGDKEVEIGNTGVVKQVLEEMLDEKRDLQKKLEKATSTIDDQRSTIDAGTRDLEQLQRNLDALRAKNPHDRALTEAVITILELAETIGQLPDERKAALGSHALPVLNTALQRVRAAYGTKFNFTEATVVSDNVLDDIARQVNDETEVDD